MARQVTTTVRNKIKQWEGMKLMPYQDGAGVWTDGYGNTHNVVPSKKISQAKADADLVRNLREAEGAVERLVKVPLTDNQFGALVSFVFNVGVEAFRTSTLLRLLNAGNYNAVPLQLARWNKITVKGRKVPSEGLTNRRAAEVGLWATGAFVASAPTPARDPVRPLMLSKTVQGTALTSAGAIGSTLTETANQVQMVSDYSDTLRIVFVALMVGGIALTLWGRIRLRNEEGM